MLSLGQFHNEFEYHGKRKSPTFKHRDIKFRADLINEYFTKVCFRFTRNKKEDYGNVNIQINLNYSNNYNSRPERRRAGRRRERRAGALERRSCRRMIEPGRALRRIFPTHFSMAESTSDGERESFR